MDDFSKGGLHETDGLWWVLEMFFTVSKNQAPGAFISANSVFEDERATDFFGFAETQPY